MEKIKRTKAREIILDVIRKSKVPLTTEEIFSSISNKGINLSTVYRTLTTYEKNDILKKDISPLDRQAYYSIKSKEHYHILECVYCHKQIKLDYCPYEEIEENIKNTTGFNIADQNSIIYGVCGDCQNKHYQSNQ